MSVMQKGKSQPMKAFQKLLRRSSLPSELPLSESQKEEAQGDELLEMLLAAHNQFPNATSTIYSRAAYEIISVRKELIHTRMAGYKAGESVALAERDALAGMNDTLRHENRGLRQEIDSLVSSSRKMILFLAEQQAKGNIDKVPNFGFDWDADSNPR